MPTLGEMLGFKARAVANEFLSLARQTNNPLTTMKLMKLLYLAQGWSLGVRHRPLFNERIEAWKYGPVVPQVYHAFKEYGSSPIVDDAETYGEGLSDEERALIRKVWEVYGSYTASDLSRMSHDPNGPWAKALNAAGDPNARSVLISNAAMQEYFSEKAAVA